MRSSATPVAPKPRASPTTSGRRTSSTGMPPIRAPRTPGSTHALCSPSSGDRRAGLPPSARQRHERGSDSRGRSTGREDRCARRGSKPLPGGAVAVLAPRPAAGPALAILEFLPCPANAAFSGRLLLGVLDPANELIARQGRDVLPGVE